MRTFIVSYRVIKFGVYVLICIVNVAMLALLMASLIVGSIGLIEGVAILLNGLPPVVTMYTMLWRYHKYEWWSKDEIEELSKVRSMVTFGVLFVITLTSSILYTVLEVQGQLVESFSALSNSNSLAVVLVVLSWVSPPAVVIGFVVAYKENLQSPPIVRPPRMVGRFCNDDANISRTHSMVLGHVTTEYKIGSFTSWDPSKTHRMVILRAQLETKCQIPER
ncbi:uncharacterized protein BT62DRAFT_1070476 [Guyanagaster necrorhizus]|uniref:Uncharacterized protein n=1 Tax=Guyanagaster necrorhizus TaxID=856835 RepID=A0A9P8AYQ5_9AGAR|nr:uncharacterized protein BT62DRAFT_1070476 [Guyanagaster necrorhizus MCA 3950]KAG7452750.1 hypothetical protein BT62DRAFT_1070476 [Guyanagaster necrorhizus MCA 3950]